MNSLKSALLFAIVVLMVTPIAIWETLKGLACLWREIRLIHKSRKEIP